MKRFYRTAAVAPASHGFSVTLDGRPMLTPGKRAFAAPTQALADAVAAEWQAQGERIAPAAMPMTRFVNTVIDRIVGREAEVIEELAGYAATDLLCYRADHPQELAERQAALWDPQLEWLAVRHGARLAVTAGVSPVAQDAEALARVRQALAGHDAFRLAGLHTATTVTGSVVLGLAFAEGAVDAAAAWAAASVDEDFQIAQWGEDAEAARRRTALRSELDEAARYLELLAAERSKP